MEPSDSAIRLGLASGDSSGERYPDFTTISLNDFGCSPSRVKWPRVCAPPAPRSARKQLIPLFSIVALGTHTAPTTIPNEMHESTYIPPQPVDRSSVKNRCGCARTQPRILDRKTQHAVQPLNKRRGVL